MKNYYRCSKLLAPLYIVGMKNVVGMKKVVRTIIWEIQDFNSILQL